MAEEHLLFVYGSLKTGFEPHERILAPFVQRAMGFDVAGQLYHMPDGYPALVLSSRDRTSGTGERVFGELLALPADFDFSDIDEWEVFLSNDVANSLYIREQRTWLVGAQTCHVWVYHMALEQVQARGGLLLADGTWHG